MQVTLTPHAEELLREAMLRHPGRSPEELVEQALAERLELNAAPITDPVRERLKRIPGLELPDNWPPQFSQFEPLRVEGEPISEQLVRERR